MSTNPFPRVLTVTLNPAVDQTVEVANLVQGDVNRALKMQVDVGGKGINVASCLADFGVSCGVTGLLGSENAALFRTLFERKRIVDHCFYAEGLTRINTKLVDIERGETTDINMPGIHHTPERAEAQIERMQMRLETLCEQADWIVFAGSLPPGLPADTYARLIQTVRAKGRRAALDTSGAPLAAALRAGPALAKPNRAELSEYLGRTLPDLAAVVAAARELLTADPAPEVVAISMGEDGALLLDRQHALLAEPLQIEVRSTVGAGDAMVAGLVAAQLEGLGLAATARLATAFSAAKLQLAGPHLPAPEEVRRLAEKVRVRAID
jgi:1-phosphofructokinase